MTFILKSLLITACVSTAAGFALRTILGFTEIFLLATIVQFLIFYYINLFFNKIILHFIFKMTTKLDRPIFGRSAAMHLTKMACHMGP